MKQSLKKKEEALRILSTYKGNNTYMLMIRRDVYVRKDTITDFQTEFVLKNKDLEPVPINRMTKIPEWFGLSLQKKWECEFVPEKLKIVSYLGETDTTYCFYIQYRQSVPPQMLFMPKRAVLNNVFVEDYHNMKIDFDRYDNLSTSVDEGRKLYPHQKEGVQFLLTRKRCILADSMGTGKTTTLAVAAIEGNFDSVLIICPASLKTGWKEELMYYVPEKDISIIEGGFEEKKKDELEGLLGYAVGKSHLTKGELVKEAKEVGKWRNNRFVIVNYDILKDFYDMTVARSEESKRQVLENSPLLKYIYNRKSCVIIDEAHRLSTYDSGQYKIVNKLIKNGNPDCLFLATGTPITNNPMNLYYVLNLVENDVTSDLMRYKIRYCDADVIYEKGEKWKWTDKFLQEVVYKEYVSLTKYEQYQLFEYLLTHAKIKCVIPKGDSHLDELKEIISHLYLRRTIDDVVDLPPKHVHEVRYNLTPWQKDEYEVYWNEYLRLRDEKIRTEKTKLFESKQKAIEANDEKRLKEIEAKLSELDRQENVELNKELLEGAAYRAYLSNQMVPNTIALCDKILETEDKVIIACCYDEELNLLKKHYGDMAVIYNGKCSAKEKDKNKYEFIHNPKIKVFIGNIRSCSMGLTLIVAHSIVFNNLDWTPAYNSQMTDRIHRIGQTKECNIYIQLYKNTQYEYMWDAVMRKQMVSDAIIKREQDK